MTDKPDWWPQNPYKFSTTPHRFSYWQDASDECWKAFCEWIDSENNQAQYQEMSLRKILKLTTSD